NRAKDGGGMANQMESSPELNNVTIIENDASSWGGGLYNVQASSPTLRNVVISGNWASGAGGGIANSGNSSPQLVNVTISGNSSTDGRGICNDESSPSISNSIVWNNSTFGGDTESVYASIKNFGESSSTISNSLIANIIDDNGHFFDFGAIDSGNNISANPEFREEVNLAVVPTV